LPGSTVTVKSVDTGIERVVLTDDAGRYRVSNLALGLYEVTAGLPGFQTAVRSGITLTIGREAVVNFILKVGEVTERVTVTGEAPLVETRSGGLGDVVDHKTVTELPLNGRDLTSLLTLQSGTVNSTVSTGTGTNTGFGQKVSISGARPYDNSILMDGTEVKGVDATVPAGLSGSWMGAEAVQEFKIERNAYSAQYGNSAGGVINVVTKSGTNEFHGSVYEFLRNDNLDAANFRDAAIVDASGRFVGKAKPEFKRNQFGFSLGGPIIRNRTFFFGNYEGLRDRLGFTSFVRTFTAATRQGAVNPAIVPYLQLWPLPGPGAQDLRDGTAREPISLKQPTDDNFYQVRVDHQLSGADSLFARYTRQKSERIRPEPITRWSHRSFTYNTFVTIEEKKIFSPQLLNTFRFGFSRLGIGEESVEDPATDASLHFVPRSAWRFPLGAPPILGSINVTGVSGIGLGRGWVDRKINRFQYIDDVLFNRGAHSLKFGFNWQRLQYNGDNPSRPAGEFTFGSIGDFLRGQPSQFRGDILPGTDSVRGIRYHIAGWYVQDDWNVHPRLTVNLGFRHEFYTVPTEVNGKIANLRKPFTDTEVTLGDPWFENPSRKSFMPRVGLALDPTGSGKTAIRAGFGLFYNQMFPDTFEQAAFRTAPFALETNIRGVGRIPFPGIFDAVVRQGLGDADLHLFPFDYARNPHVFQWNLSLQREILPQTAVTLAYAGSRGLNLMKRVNLNTARADTVNGRYVFPAGAAVPNPFWDLELTSREMSADSWYHGMQVGLQRRFHQGFQLQASYTFSRAIDEASQFNNDFQGIAAQHPYYWDSDMLRSLAPFDVRHVFVSSSVWELPFGPGKPVGSSWTGLAEKLLAGWQMGGILSLSTGPPTTLRIQLRNDLSQLGVADDYPDLVGSNNNPVLGDPDRYFDPLMFGFPAARTIGNLGRNTLISPGVANLDFSLSKNVRATERVHAQFRVECFNLLNRANLG
ncbi:MAG: TonB-dependent receptor, partial [Acidobacteria bacterium]|nr:TonB-dependent receptor [Acidobacteriota bacterium]